MKLKDVFLLFHPDDRDQARFYLRSPYKNQFEERPFLEVDRGMLCDDLEIINVFGEAIVDEIILEDNVPNFYLKNTLEIGDV